MPIKLRRKKKAGGADASLGEGGWDSASLGSTASMTGVQSVYRVQKIRSLPKLHRAVAKGNQPKARRLAAGMKSSELNSTDKEKRTALHFACAGAQEELMVHLCSELKADPNIRDSSGCTPLHRSIQAGTSTTGVSKLIEAGARVNEADRQGRTPLHEAAERGRSDVFAVLLAHRGNVEAVEMAGSTALHMAARGGFSEIVSQLVREGANVDKANGQGLTCLMLAAAEGHREVVETLREAKADPEPRDLSGLSAVDLALRNGHQQCAQLVQEYQLSWAREGVNHIPSSSHPLPSHSPLHTPSTHHPSLQGSYESWNSESEGEEFATGHTGNFQTPRGGGGGGNFQTPRGGGGGGINLREAMAALTAKRKDDEKDKIPPIPEPHPPVGVVNGEAEDATSSDWDEESDHTHQAAVDSAHIPAVGGASRKLSAVQSEKRQEEREAVTQDATDGVGEDPENGSILSTESESDLPMFGGPAPSTTAPPPQSHLPPISQGQPLAVSSPLPPRTPSPTVTSPTIVTPLSATAGGLSPVDDQRAEPEREDLNEQGQTLQLTEKEKNEREVETDSREDIETAAARRKYERDNELLLTFQARQKRKLEAGPDSKPDPVPFPIPHSSASSTRDTSDGESGSKVQLMKEQWEKGAPLQLPAFSSGASVVGVAREAPVSGGGKREGSGGGRESEKNGKSGGGRERQQGDLPPAARGGNVGSGGGGGGGSGGGGDGKGGGDGRKDDNDEKDESEETEEEEEEEGEGEKGDVQGVSSTTPLLQTSRQRAPPTQSDPWDSDSSDDEPLPPPPILHSTLLSPASHLHYHTLTNVKSAEGEEGNRSSNTITPKSHDPNVESHDQSCDLSAAPSHLSSALLDSAHLSNLATSLHDTQQSLSRSQRSVRGVEEVGRRLQAQLEEALLRLSEANTARQSLESAKLDLELKLREVEYHLQEEREAVRSGQTEVAALRERASAAEERLGREVELRQSAELQRREVELQARGNLVSTQQLQEKVAEQASQLQTEREAKAVQEGLYKEQLRLLQELQTESARIREQETEVRGQLEAAQLSRQSLEEQFQRLQRENTQVQVELNGERCRGEEVRGRLEGELREVRERLREKADKLVSSEDVLLTSQQKFECDLGELRSKVATLSSGLDSEILSRKQVESERDRLRSQLDKASRTLQAASKRAVGREKELQELVESQRGEREAAQRELARAQAQLEQLTSQRETLETRLSQTEVERGEHAAETAKRTNQIAVLQREGEQWEQRLATLEEALAREKAVSSERSAELAERERALSAAQTEVARLTEQLSSCRQRLGERETSAERDQSRNEAFLESLRSEFKQTRVGLEERCQSLTAEVARLREEGERKVGETREKEREGERLQSLLREATVARERAEGELRSARQSCAVLERERKAEQERATERQKELQLLREAGVAGERERETLQQQMLALETSLSQQEEGEVRRERERAGGLETQLREAREREEGLRGELLATREERTRLQEMVSRVRGEAMQFRDEKEAVQVALQLSQREAAEARGLWETEIRSRASMSLRVVELERIQQEVAPAIETEKQLMHKAREQKKVAEKRLETLQVHCVELEREVRELQTELREARQQLKEAESQRNGSREAEFSSIRQQLGQSQRQLAEEVEGRARAEDSARQASQQLASYRDSSHWDKELRRVRRSNHQLEEEVRRLEETIASSMVDRRAMEAAVRRAEDEAHQKLSLKLQEVNSHLQQQALAQASLQRKSEAEVREQIDQLQRQTALTNKFKGLYEAELGRSERLAQRVRDAEQTADQADSRARFERSRSQYLISQPHPVTSSTPHKHHLTGHASSSGAADRLLSSVQSELDRSIAKHLASIPAGTRWSSSAGCGRTAEGHMTPLPGRPSLSTSHHLDSIRRNYHV